MDSPADYKHTESTRKIASNLSASIPDISLFGDNDEFVPCDNDEYNPWSDTFLQIQIGQSGIKIDTEKSLVEKNTIYNFQGIDINIFGHKIHIYSA